MILAFIDEVDSIEDETVELINSFKEWMMSYDFTELERVMDKIIRDRIQSEQAEEVDEIYSPYYGA